MHGNMTATGADLAAKKPESNRGWDRGGRTRHPAKNSGLTKSRLLVRLTGRDAANKDDNIMGIWNIARGRGCSPR